MNHIAKVYEQICKEIDEKSQSISQMAKHWPYASEDEDLTEQDLRALNEINHWMAYALSLMKKHNEE